MKWSLIGCGGLILVAGIIVTAGVFFVKHKAQQAGLDPELMHKNPALAVAKMVTAFNPDLELVKVDDSKGIITVYNKKDNKTLIINMEDAKKGKFVFQEVGKDAVSIETHGDGASGTMDIKSGEGTMHIGAGGKAPNWIPVYPGASPEGTFSAQGDKGDTGSFHFTTKDPVEKVINWYVAELQKAGLKVTSNVMNENGKASGGMATGSDEAKKRTVSVITGAESEGTSVNITYESKK
jgi:hypothetical protein